jgi:hypothetical protein
MSPTRRAVGLVAASALGVSTAVFGLGGVAQAAPAEWAFSSDDPNPIAVPDGICAVAWTLIGGPGGVGDEDRHPAPPRLRNVTTEVTAGDAFTLAPGGAGFDFADGGAAGTNPEGDGAFDGHAGILEEGGAGSGAASVVLVDGEVYLGVYGARGGGASSAPPGTAEDGGLAVILSDDGDEARSAPEGSLGRITGQGIACEEEEEPVQTAPEAPTGLIATAESGSITLAFTPTWTDDENGTDADSWQYSLNGGTWTAVTTTADDYGDRAFTLTGLSNGTTYSVRVRGVSDTAGAGAASSAASATPALPIGAPADVVATAGPSSVTITWSAPTSAGTFPVASYVVGWSGGQMGGAACESVPVSAERVCVFPAEPGGTYSFDVWAVDTKGNHGIRSDAVSAGKTPAPTVPATVPAAQGELEVPADQQGPMAVGTEIKLTGSGYLPFSTVTVAIYSEPQVLTSVVTDATGSFEVTVTVPDGLANGEHTLVASGVDPDGNVRYLALPVTVTGGVTGAGGLAYTGFDIAAPLTGGLAALALGAGLIVVSRRRAAA